MFHLNNIPKENFDFKHKTDSNYNHWDVHNAGANDRRNCVSCTGVMNNSNREQSTNDINDGNARNAAFHDNVLTAFVNSDFSYVPNTNAKGNIVSDVNTGVNDAVTPNSDINNHIGWVSSDAVANATPGFVSNICGNDNLDRISITGSYDNSERVSYTGFYGNDFNMDVRGGLHYPSDNVFKFGASDITRSSFNNTPNANSDFKHNTGPNNIYGDLHNTDANDGHYCVSSTGVVNNSNWKAGTNDIRDSSTGNIVSSGNVLNMVAEADFSCAPNTSANGNIASVTNIGFNAVPEFALSFVMNYISGCVSGYDAEDITSAFSNIVDNENPNHWHSIGIIGNPRSVHTCNSDTSDSTVKLQERTHGSEQF